jgi:hypothetical protein
MEGILKKPIFLVISVLMFVNVGVYVVGKIVVEKVTENVIKKLQKEYSPSPYGPGFNPDLVAGEAFNTSANQERLYMELSTIGETVSLKENFVEESDQWLVDWEVDRGF